MKIKLRDYQSKAIKDVFAELRKNDKVILRLPTGAGKSVIATKIMEIALENKRRVCVITDRKVLKDQMADYCARHNLEFGVISGSDERYLWGAHIQVCTIQTLARRRNIDHGLGFNLFIIDEAHITFKEHIKIMDQFKGAKFIGLTATPWSKGLGRNWDSVVNGPSIRDLIDMGFLCESIVYAPPKGQMDVSKVKLTAGEYNEKQLGEVADDPKLYASITQEWQAKAQGKSTIVFATSIIHSKKICERFKSIGVEAAHVDAYSED